MAKRYQVRFTKAALRDLSKAVSRYNSMLTRYQKSGGKTIAKRADVSESYLILKRNSYRVIVLRQQRQNGEH